MSVDPRPDHSPEDGPDRGVLAVVALALVVRAVVVVASLRDLAIPRSTDDYVGMAQQWMDKGLYTRVEWPPVYTLLCRAFLAWFGPEAVFHALLVVHLILGTVSVYLVFLIARRLGLCRRTALLATGIMAIEPSVVSHTGLALTETVYVFLLLAGLHLALLARDASAPRVGTSAALGAGALLGIGSLARFIGLPIAVAAVLWLALAGGAAGRVRRVKRAAVVLAVVAIPNLIWATRNYVDLGHFEISASGGHNLAVMWVGPARLIHEGYAVDSVACMQIWAEDAGPDWFSRDRFVYARAAGGAAVRWAVAHPFPVIMGLIRSAGLLWLGPGRAPFEKLIGVEPLPYWLTGLLYGWHFLFTVLTVAGACFWWSGRRDARAGLALVVLLIVAQQLSLGCSGYNRYLVPIVPFAAMLVAVALVDGRQWLGALASQAQTSGWIDPDTEPRPKPSASDQAGDSSPDPSDGLGNWLARIQTPTEQQEDDDG